MKYLVTLMASLSLTLTVFSQNCNTVILGIDSYISEGGPEYAAVNVFNSEGNPVTNTMAQYSINDPFYDLSLCLPYGCYSVVLDPAFVPENMNSMMFSAVSNGAPLEITNFTSGFGLISYSFCLVEPNFACPEEMAVVQQDCNIVAFEIGSAAEGESVVWSFGDGTIVEGGHFAEHNYLQNGVYEVSAYYQSNDCPGATYEAMVEVSCTNNCDASIEVNVIDCDSYVFTIPNYSDVAVNWNFGDESSEISTPTADHTYAENGLYTVTATFEYEGCSAPITVTNTVEVGCDENPCPSSIFAAQQGENCLHWVFEAGNYVPGESASWFINGEQQAENGHFMDHTFAEPGVYTICVYLINDLCSLGIELCTTITVVSDCNNQIECSIQIESTNLGNGLWEFTAIGSPEVYPMVWNFGDGTIIEATWVVQHEFAPGQYEVCGTINSDFCSEPVSDCVGVTVTEQNCEASFIVVETNNPGVYEFINTSTYGPNTQFLWNYGQGAVSTNVNGYIVLTENGVYEICLTITDGDCTDQFCTAVNVTAFEQGCQDNEIELVIAAENPGGLQGILSLDLTSIDYLFEIEIPLSGNSFTFTYADCLPDGCYELELSSEAPMLFEFITATVYVNGALVDIVELVNGAAGGSITVGVGMDCVESINETSESQFTIYPNPTDELLFIQGGNSNSVSKVRLINALGAVVYQNSSSPAQNQLDVSAFPAGIYLLEINTQGRIETHHVVIK